MIKLFKKLFSGIYFIINYITLFYRNVKFDTFPLIKGILSIRGRGKLFLGDKVIINSMYNANPVGTGYKTAFHIAPNAIIKIGDNVGISNALFYAKTKIEVEDNVLIGGGCQIYDTDFHSLDYHERVFNGDNDVKVKPVRIKEGAFIGTSCIILKGVTIGARSIVAAGAVVAKDIPDNEIWGGNPAKMLKKIDVK